MENKKDPTLTAIVIFITLISLAIRLAPALQIPFPLNDGGLFYQMIIDLQKAHFTLPAFATYNAAKIPFAYPPLAFYFTGLLSSLLHISVLDLVRILPTLISALTVPAFYLLAREIMASKIQVAFSVFAFAMLPRAFAWNIMGGGITRSFGLFFALLTMVSAYKFYNGHQTRHFWTSVLFGALTVVTHPEATVHTAITALIFYLWKDRSKEGLLKSLGIAVAILMLTAPWWGTVVAYHGLAPFLASINASAQDSYNALVGLFIFFRFQFTDEALLPILAILGLIGLFVSLAQKQTLLPAWMFILHLLEPRGGTLYMMLPLAMLNGVALESVILPAIQQPDMASSSPPDFKQALEQMLGGKISRYFILFFFAYCVMSAYSTGLKIQQDLSLNSVDENAFSWVREHTSADSQFLLVTGQLPLRDAWSEWFPVLTDRVSQATVFGYEWVNDGQFGTRVDNYKSLQACAYQDASCLDTWKKGSTASFSYVYIWNRTNPKQYPLTLYLQNNQNYQVVFQNERAIIFHKSN